jgi:hypothetical protein
MCEGDYEPGKRHIPIMVVHFHAMRSATRGGSEQAMIRILS